MQTLFRRNRSAQRLDDEIQFHLDQQIRENIAAGMSPDEARCAARRTFGNPTLLKEEARDTWGWILLERLGKDFRYAVRALRASPLFTAAVVLSLALGIGANTAIFTLLHASLWKPLPVKDPQQIFHLMRASSEGDFVGEFSYSYPLYQKFAKIGRPVGRGFRRGHGLSKKIRTR